MAAAAVVSFELAGTSTTLEASDPALAGTLSHETTLMYLRLLTTVIVLFIIIIVIYHVVLIIIML